MEVAIAVAILGILTGLGWSAIHQEVDRYRMMKTARMLHSDIQHLRALAISMNRETRLHLHEGDTALDPADAQIGVWLLQVGNRSSGSTEWDTLPLDEDGVPDDSEGQRSISVGGADEAPNVSLAAWDPLVGPGSDNRDSLVFSPRGWLTKPPADFGAGYIQLEIVNKAALGRGGDESVSIRVSRGGLARLEVAAPSTLPSTAVGTAEASSQ